MKIRLTKSAVHDLDSIDSYIRQDNAQSAAKTVFHVLDSIEGLAAFPNIGRPGRLPGTRELVVSTTPFIAVYRVQQNIIWVLRILHSAQKWP